MSGRGVLVAEAEALAPLFDGEALSYLMQEPLEAVCHVPGLRLIPYGDVTGQSRLLAAFLPQQLAVDGKNRGDLLIAIAPAPLDGGGSYQAIL
jgi:hypothetical protein